jgi:proteasome lid subunit RPN8/RPN11
VADHRAEDTDTVIKLPEEELDTVYEAIEEQVEHLFALVTADSQYQSSITTYGFGESPEEEVCIADISQINVGDSTSVNHPEHKIDALADMAREIDAEWYLGHNHPSGNPNPSEADRNSNQNYLGSLPGYSGKLIFVEDSNTEARISAHPLDSFSEAEITDETYSNLGARMEYNRAENDRFGL